MNSTVKAPDNSKMRAELVLQPDGSEQWLIDGQEVREYEPGDPEGVQRFKEVTGEYRRLDRKILGDLYGQCVLLLVIRAERLFVAAGYKSFKECAEKEFGIDGRYAEQLSDCAREYAREQFVDYGVAIAIAGLQYLSATPQPDTTADLPNVVLKFGSGAGRPFPDATLRQIREEIRGVREENAPSYRQIVPPDLTETARLLSDRVGAAKFKLKNFKSGDDVTTGLVIELPNASREEVVSQLAKMLGALSKPE